MTTIDRGINIRDARGGVSFFFSFLFKGEIERSHHGEMTPLGFAVIGCCIFSLTAARAIVPSSFFSRSINLPLPGAPLPDEFNLLEKESVQVYFTPSLDSEQMKVVM